MNEAASDGPTAATLGTSSAWFINRRVDASSSALELSMSLRPGPLVSAVAAGNTAILKPSEFTPQYESRRQGHHRRGVPPDEVAVVNARRPPPTCSASSTTFTHWISGCRKRSWRRRPRSRPGDARAGRQVTVIIDAARICAALQSTSSGKMVNTGRCRRTMCMCITTWPTASWICSTCQYPRYGASDAGDQE